MSTSRERDIPPPRRKSCEACRAAKRRCDLALPTCFRCAQRNLACVYPGLPAPDSIPDMLAFMDETMSAPYCMTDFNFTPTPVLHGYMSTNWSIPGDLIQQNLQLMSAKTKSSLDLSVLLASRFQYAIDTLQEVPRMMVTENRTPWCHPELYKDGMPKVMQVDAYACCALYITKNPINGPLITTHIQSRHQELILSSLPTSPPEVLAHTQALLLYQIMYLFDPTLNSNTAIETLSLSALESAAFFLFSSTHFPPAPQETAPGMAPSTSLTSLLPNTLQSTIQFWKLWVFGESARRTILFTFYFIQIFRLLHGDRDLKCDGKLGILHSWYSSAHLWNAPNALEFAVAWAEREHFIVQNVNFSKVLNEAQPSDVDLFGRMLLVTLLGIDQVQAWFCRRGAIL
ncbi:hypothetical protein ARAM_002674 [Aspergillus rambellii]|uniref:Zn(2)-C6 fungal-type domain-containing protein n=1 Tax=Aspergillus rambellii TaxID=308745 RepID=A0A0F8UBE8_9EURO|nr:hypothetical protein ARAM_002674 [Aspergillus rambellii]